ncbi:universal stress protein [Cytobacillus spongiae]|uniref:universal stress protein n=1 Tax=Cytobacillus spongiae TaxID=2901381 RepID=UPI001F42E439|nr:universal stress protein [Cytobacillus spongiae]UII55482.1 universal stress protein [Cytobacillus spongiae]
MKESILICVSNPNHGERLIQRGKRLADAFGGDCYILSVFNGKMDDLDFNQLQTRLLFESLAEKHDIKMLSVPSEGRKVSEVISETTKTHHITQIVIGQAVQTKLEQVFRNSLINELFQELEGVDLHVVEVQRDLYDPSESCDRGIQAQLIKKNEHYELLLEKSEEKGSLKGTFFRELSTNFSNGFFVIQQEKTHKVVRVQNGHVDKEAVEG